MLIFLISCFFFIPDFFTYVNFHKNALKERVLDSVQFSSQIPLNPNKHLHISGPYQFRLSLILVSFQINALSQDT